MVIVKLQGGLGNQMFQYAAARGMAKPDSDVYLDCDFLNQNSVDTGTFTARHFALGLFKNIGGQIAKPWQISFFKSYRRPYRLVRLFLKPSIKIIIQQENEYIEAEPVNHLYLDGYFQSERYFKHIRKDLVNEFAFPPLGEANELLKQQIISTANAVSLHIRRGDYSKSKPVFETHGVLPVSYYQTALAMLQKKHSPLTVFVFSDDMAWAKQNIEPDNIQCHFVDNNVGSDSWKDMALMSFCKHHIIANSSFSWWGAWLSVNNGLVFAPQNWLNPLKVKFNIHDFVPESWTIVNYG